MMNRLIYNCSLIIIANVVQIMRPSLVLCVNYALNIWVMKPKNGIKSAKF